MVYEDLPADARSALEEIRDDAPFGANSIWTSSNSAKSAKRCYAART